MTSIVTAAAMATQSPVRMDTIGLFPMRRACASRVADGWAATGTLATNATPTARAMPHLLGRPARIPPPSTRTMMAA
jgi:hypothetical protein